MDGVLNVLKPAGMTSHDVVSAVRRIYGQKRVGHAGTLDPAAAGVLPVFLGRATRLLEYAPTEPKIYRAEWLVGCATDTEDTAGTVTAAAAVPAWDMAAWQQRANAFLGTIRQRPSAYSAVKIGGRKAYELARAQQEVELPEREIRLDEFVITAWQPPVLRARIVCSGGTYIRALGRDLAAAAGTAMTMSFLLRERVGNFCLETAHTLEEIAAAPETVCAPAETIVAHLPRTELDAAEGARFRNGMTVPAAAQGTVTVWAANEFLGTAEGDGRYIHPKKVWTVQP